MGLEIIYTSILGLSTDGDGPPLPAGTVLEGPGSFSWKQPI